MTKIHVYNVSVKLKCFTWEMRLGLCQLTCTDSLSFSWNGVAANSMILKQSLEQDLRQRGKLSKMLINVEEFVRSSLTNSPTFISS